MDTTLKQKIGIVLSLIGGVIILGFKWTSGLTIGVGFILVIFGLALALRKDLQSNKSKWIHNNTLADDD